MKRIFGIRINKEYHSAINDKYNALSDSISQRSQITEYVKGFEHEIARCVYFPLKYEGRLVKFFVKEDMNVEIEIFDDEGVRSKVFVVEFLQCMYIGDRILSSSKLESDMAILQIIVQNSGIQNGWASYVEGSPE